jgi:hypothetical protein
MLRKEACSSADVNADFVFLQILESFRPSHGLNELFGVLWSILLIAL